MVDMQGEIMVSTKQLKLTPKEVKEVDWFSQASGGFTYISDVFIDEKSGLAMITISQPVENIFEGRVGVIAFDLRMDKFKEVVEKIHAGDTGHAYVVDKKGNLMSHRDFDEKVLTQFDVKAIPGVINVMAAESYDVLAKTERK